MDGPASLTAHVAAAIRSKGHAVVVVAEGAGAAQRVTAAAGAPVHAPADDGDGDGECECPPPRDPPVGPWLKAALEAALLREHGIAVACKYIEPSLLVRAVPPCAADALLALQAAQGAVHGAMAGFTAFATGLVANHVVHIPLAHLTQAPARLAPITSRTYERLLTLTGQPDPFAFADSYAAAIAALRSEEGGVGGTTPPMGVSVDAAVAVVAPLANAAAVPWLAVPAAVPGLAAVVVPDSAVATSEPASPAAAEPALSEPVTAPAELPPSYDAAELAEDVSHSDGNTATTTSTGGGVSQGTELAHVHAPAQRRHGARGRSARRHHIHHSG